MPQILSNRPPFFNFKEDLHVLVQLIHQKRSPRPTGPVAEKWLTDEAWAYIQKCTVLDPQERPDMRDVVREFGGRFLGEGVREGGSV